MKYIRKGILIGILLTACLNILLSEDLERKTIRIATLEHSPVVLKDGTGVGADMLSELLDKMGYNIAIEGISPWQSNNHG